MFHFIKIDQLDIKYMDYFKMHIINCISLKKVNIHFYSYYYDLHYL